MKRSLVGTQRTFFIQKSLDEKSRGPLNMAVPVKLYPAHAQTEVLISRPPGHNACADQPCSLLCLPQPGHRHTCVCPDGAPTVTMPNGELQCQCPTGYQLQNNTCVKTGEHILPNHDDDDNLVSVGSD